MKGFDLCQRFFWEVGHPVLERELPECIPHLAVGLVGGSQSHGYDDDISRDHGWGPGFTVFLVESAYEQFGQPLQVILDRLPREFLGYGWQRPPEHTCGVIALGQCIKSFIGCETPPEDPLDWLRIPEEYLFEVTPKRLFHDAPGMVTERFKLFASYPEDAWKQRLRACLGWVSEWGEKHLPRSETRGDNVPTLTYACNFATYVMKSVFLLNHRYAPYHKWLHREFLTLPYLAPDIAPLLQKVLEEPREKAAWASKIVDHLVHAIEQLGYKPEIRSAEEERHVAYQTRLFDFRPSIRDSIQHPVIRELPSFLEMQPPVWKATWTWVRHAQ